jgi:cell cycle arrest protein BUB2
MYSQLGSPNQILRSLPGLNASRIIRVAMTFASKIPEDMYEEIINHAK